MTDAPQTERDAAKTERDAAIAGDADEIRTSAYLPKLVESDEYGN